MGRSLTCLGIETSCDECAVAVVDSERRIWAEVIVSQETLHRPYHGVVPEIAARDHLSSLDRAVGTVLEKSKTDWCGIDMIAATAGPGLVGGLLVGMTMAKTAAMALGKPFFAVNHLEAHALSARLTDDRLDFPFLALLISGGHCQCLVVEGSGRYRLYGETRDDSCGEAFDKAAVLLGLPFPGGPALESLAEEAEPAPEGTDNSESAPLPRPLLDRPGCDFSFSGLKSALRRRLEQHRKNGGVLNRTDKARLARAFQDSVSDILADRAGHAMRRFSEEYGPKAQNLVLCGGVAANRTIRDRLGNAAQKQGFACIIPPPALCTDNGAMIAWAALERVMKTGSDSSSESVSVSGFAAGDSLAHPPRPRWPVADSSVAAILS